MNSINTNVGAMIALQNLSATNSELAEVQIRISTGKKINGAKDNPANWAIAQTMRGRVMALDAVKDSLDRGKSVIDVAMSAGEEVSDLLTQMKQKALAASDTSLDTVSRAALATDFNSLRDQISKVVANASFNGVNLLAAGANGFSALANDDGSQRLTVAGQSLALGGAAITFTAATSFTSATSASNLIGVLNTAFNNVSAALTHLGTSSKALDMHETFIGKLQDTLDAGIGNLVDADMAKESARLQALQIKQQLAIRALSIANSYGASLLQLFR
jgi:flagellin